MRPLKGLNYIQAGARQLRPVPAKERSVARPDTTFLVTQGAAATPVVGTVVYANSAVVFWPEEHLLDNATYTATITTGALNPAGSNAGSTERVTVTATMRPTIEKSPSCARPGKPEKSIAPKPQIDVTTPSLNVGQMRLSVLWGGTPGVS